MSQRIKFTARYTHLWPSRAETTYPATWSGLVKDEVAAAAIAKGVAVPDTEEGDALPRNVAQLHKIARDEELDVGEAKGVDELQAAIRAARAAKASPLPDEAKTE